MRAIRREDPGTARAGTVDTAFHIHFHTIGHAIRFVRGHIRKDTSAYHVAIIIEVETWIYAAQRVLAT